MRVKRLQLGGKVGKVLRANEEIWIHKLLIDNPNLFGAFAARENNTFHKTMWHGEFPGKLLTGIARMYAMSRNEKTLAVGNEMTDWLAKTQDVDGYLGPWWSEYRLDRGSRALEPEPIGKWDTWGIYHCTLGLYRWYKVCGNQKALDVAIKALDYVYEYFTKGDRHFIDQKWGECNFAIGHIYALLYEEIGKKEYLEFAERLVEVEWNTPYWDFYQKKVITAAWMKKALEGVPYHATEQPRWEALYTLETLGALYRITGKKDYFLAMESLWKGIVAWDRLNIGSFGSWEGAAGNRYGDGSETCNTVAWTAFSADFLALTHDPKVADELELSYYNAVMGSLLGNYRDYTYFNASTGTREPARIVLEGHSFEGARDMSCCQANGNAGLSLVNDWAVLTEKDSLYINYYGESSVSFSLEDGKEATLRQTTTYPACGKITLEMTLSAPTLFTLYLRIPAWSKSTAARLNGERLEATAGTYLRLNREWKEGDRIELELDMTPHYWHADKEGMEHKLSMYSGPILMTLQPEVEGVERNLVLPVAALDASRLIPVEDGLAARVVTLEDGKEITLRAYSDCGKNGEYYISWISVKA